MKSLTVLIGAIVVCTAIIMTLAQYASADHHLPVPPWHNDSPSEELLEENVYDIDDAAIDTRLSMPIVEATLKINKFPLMVSGQLP